MQELAVAIDAMDSDPSLWHCYFNDFITYQLKLADQGRTPQGNFAGKILHTFFSYLHEQKAPHKMAGLHCYVKVHHMNLIHILRPLSKIEEVS